MGRPTIIDTVIATRKDKTTGAEVDVTVSDRIVAALRNGTPEAGAARSAGIDLSTLRDWLYDGARIQMRLHKGEINRAALSQRERRLADFSLAATRAIGDWEVSTNALLQSAAQGGTEVVTITEKIDPKTGNVLDRTRRVETLGPNPTIGLQRLKCRFPSEYADRTEITGAEGEPIAVSLEVRAAEVVARVAQLKAKAELPPGDSRTG